ncbi:carbohydrate-binding module family 19 protein [Ophiocordyceps camponoti-floridani]|uniref:Carbohydrate-binding module family 19 protein n=1 Tax=Ophiocordyceps camponoti-floridani TaxID=2030778 RepID=A0A8H4VE11_9HYPO|nr:carbohydrate-binding module family 19 protein [Ophiocordyceps camponoti-floridani]
MTSSTQAAAPYSASIPVSSADRSPSSPSTQIYSLPSTRLASSAAQTPTYAAGPSRADSLSSPTFSPGAISPIAASHRNDSVPSYKPETSPAAATLLYSQGTSSEASPPTIILSAQSTFSSVVSISSIKTLDNYPAATESGPGYGAHVAALPSSSLSAEFRATAYSAPLVSTSEAFQSSSLVSSAAPEAQTSTSKAVTPSPSVLPAVPETQASTSVYIQPSSAPPAAPPAAPEMKTSTTEAVAPSSVSPAVPEIHAPSSSSTQGPYPYPAIPSDYDYTGPTDKPDLRLATETTADLAHTSSVPAEIYDKTVAKAKHLNGLYSKLSPKQACSPQQVACIEGKVARCKNGAFDLQACKGADEQCWALPLNGQAYIALACVSRDRALQILGPDGVAHATEKAAATTTTTTTLERAIRPVVTMTTVVTIVDSSTPYPAPSASSPQSCPSDAPLSDACSSPSIMSPSRAPTGKPGFVTESGLIAGPTPTITTPYLVSMPSRSMQALANPPNPTALVVMPIEDYGRAFPAPPTVSIYVTVTVTEKERETLAVTVTMPLR